jgi:hypothetical protein
MVFTIVDCVTLRPLGSGESVHLDLNGIHDRILCLLLIIIILMRPLGLGESVHLEPNGILRWYIVLLYDRWYRRISQPGLNCSLRL